MCVLKNKKVQSTLISCLIKKSCTFKEKVDCSKIIKIAITNLYYTISYTMTFYKKKEQKCSLNWSSLIFTYCKNMLWGQSNKNIINLL